MVSYRFAKLCGQWTILSSRYQQPHAIAANTEINQQPLTIAKRFFQGSQCYQLETPNGSVYIAMLSLMEVLRHEKLIVNAFNILSSRVAETEKKFNEIITKSSVDLAALMSTTEKSNSIHDLFTIEILMNFDPLVKVCIENMAVAKNQNQNKRRVTGQPASRRQPAKKNKHEDDTQLGNDEAEPPADEDVPEQPTDVAVVVEATPGTSGEQQKLDKIKQAATAKAKKKAMAKQANAKQTAKLKQAAKAKGDAQAKEVVNQPPYSSREGENAQKSYIDTDDINDVNDMIEEVGESDDDEFAGY